MQILKAVLKITEIKIYDKLIEIRNNFVTFILDWIFIYIFSI